MGLHPKHNSVVRWEPPNPNPAHFKVLDQWDVNERSVLLVEYPGCTTFGSKKVLVLNRVWTGGKKLDPHFLGPDHPVVARFVPTEDGIRAAIACARDWGTLQDSEVE